MPRSTQVPAASFSVSSTGLSPAVAELSSSLPLPTPESRMPALQPRMVETTRFGLFPFRSPLLWESRLISLPPGTEMFHFPGLASLGLYIQLRMMGHDSHRVSPFRNHRIVGCLAPPPMLIAAYRVFHRLSAPRHSPVALDILFLKNFTIPFPFPYSIVNEQHPPVFPAGATRPCLDDCREIFAPMTNHGPYVSKLVVEVGGIEPSTLCVQSRCSPS